MVKNNFFFIKLIFIFFFFLACFDSCKTTDKVKKEMSGQTDFYPEKRGFEGTILKTPNEKDFIKQTDTPPFLKDIQKGSADSLKKAAEYIRNNSSGLSEKNKFYLILISKFMQILYPYEEVEWTAASNTGENKYLAALSDVQKGIYPYWLDTDDFFSLIIPPLMLVNNNFPKTFYKDAGERIEAAKNLVPDSVLPHYLEGRLYELRKNSAKAYSSYKKAWEMDFSCYPSGIRLAKITAAQDKADEALKIAEVLYKRYKDKAEILLLIAETYIFKRNWSAAEPFIVEVLAREPENLEALLLRVEILIEKREYMKANSLLKAYSTKNKTGKKYLLLKTRIAGEWNKNKQIAIQSLSVANTYYPDDFEVLLACAEICFETKQTINGKTADDFIREVLTLEPENIQTIRLLLKNDIGTGNWQKALETAKKLTAKHPSYENNKLLLQVYLGLSRNAEALDIAKKLYNSVSVPPEDVISYYLECLYRTGNYEEIRKIISRHMRTSRAEQKSVLHYYNALLSKEDSETYLSELRSALLANPRNKDALFAMYEWYFKNRDYRNAQFYLRQVIALEPGNTKYIKLAENLAALLAR